MSNTSPTTIINDNKPNNKETCNAFGCSKGATEKIDVSAGTFGTISLSLCSLCIKKFNCENEEMRNGSSKKSLQIINGDAGLI